MLHELGAMSKNRFNKEQANKSPQPRYDLCDDIHEDILLVSLGCDGYATATHHSGRKYQVRTIVLILGKQLMSPGLRLSHRYIF